MIFRASFRYPDDEWKHIWGQVYIDAKGNKYFRASHMSRMCSEASMMKSLDKTAEWDIDIFHGPTEFTRLLNKLAPVPIATFIAT
jgi:hypothetical protein